MTMTLDKSVELQKSVQALNFSSMTTLCLALFITLSFVFNVLPVNAQEAEPITELQQSIQDLKKDVLKLNRNLFILEEDLLFPSNTQFSVFLSLDSGQLFTLDAVQLKIDNKVIANHLYTERELDALKRGGIQRLYIGNLASGEHEIIAIYTGKGPSDRDYRLGKTLTIEKGVDPQFIELQIIDDPSKEQPKFNARIWE